MSRFATLFAGAIAATMLTSTVASAQNLEVKRYNPSPWTKTFFTEIVTVNGPGKTIYLAGVGAEDEKGAVGSLPPILHLGNPYEQSTRSSRMHRSATSHQPPEVFVLAFAAWPAALRQPASPATLAPRLVLN